MEDRRESNFRAEVKKSFFDLRRLRGHELTFEKLSLDDGPPGYLDRVFFRLALFFGRTGFRRTDRSREAARYWLQDQQLRSVLCSGLEEWTNEELFVEKFVEVVIIAISDQRSSLPRDAKLIALVADELLQIGEKKYCG